MYANEGGGCILITSEKVIKESIPSTVTDTNYSHSPTVQGIVIDSHTGESTED